MIDLKKLEDDHDEAAKARYKVEVESYERERELVAAAREQHKSEGWPDKIKAAHEAEHRAKKALDDAKIANQSEFHASLIGRKVHREKKKVHGYGHYQIIHQVGVLEVWTDESKFRGAYHRRPSAGDMVVRILKKNGTPGVDIETLPPNWVVRYNDIALERTEWRGGEWGRNIGTGEFYTLWTFVAEPS